MDTAYPTDGRYMSCAQPPSLRHRQVGQAPPWLPREHATWATSSAVTANGGAAPEFRRELVADHRESSDLVQSTRRSLASPIPSIPSTDGGQIDGAGSRRNPSSRRKAALSNRCANRVGFYPKLTRTTHRRLRVVPIVLPRT